MLLVLCLAKDEIINYHPGNNSSHDDINATATPLPYKLVVDWVHKDATDPTQHILKQRNGAYNCLSANEM